MSLTVKEHDYDNFVSPDSLKQKWFQFFCHKLIFLVKYHALYKTSSLVFKKQTLREWLLKVCKPIRKQKVLLSIPLWLTDKVLTQPWITRCLLFENETWCFVLPTMVLPHPSFRAVLNSSLASTASQPAGFYTSSRRMSSTIINLTPIALSI